MGKAVLGEAVLGVGGGGIGGGGIGGGGGIAVLGEAILGGGTVQAYKHSRDISHTPYPYRREEGETLDIKKLLKNAV